MLKVHFKILLLVWMCLKYAIRKYFVKDIFAFLCQGHKRKNLNEIGIFRGPSRFFKIHKSPKECLEYILIFRTNELKVRRLHNVQNSK